MSDTSSASGLFMSTSTTDSPCDPPADSSREVRARDWRATASDGAFSGPRQS
jgi:hypothetical protein